MRFTTRKTARAALACAAAAATINMIAFAQQSPDTRPAAAPPPSAAPTTAPSGAAAAPAAAAPGGTALPETVIEAKPESLTVPGLSAAQAELRLTPGGTDIIPAEDYTAGRVQNLKDALEYSPGLLIQPRSSGTAEESRLSIRGSGLQRTFHLRGIEILQDGIPINTADGSGEFEAVEPLSLRYTEVYRGGNALRYGSTTLGGAINFVTRTGYDASPLQLRAEGGSFGYVRGQVSSGQILDDRWDYYASLSGSHADGYRDHSQNESIRFYGNLGYRISEDIETRFYVNWVNYDAQLPGSLTKQQLEDDPKQANPFQVFGDWQRNLDLYRFANKTTIRTGDHQQLELLAFYSYRDLDHPIFQIIRERSDDYGLNLRYTNEDDLFDRRNRLVAGLNVHHGSAWQTRYINIGDAEAGAKTADGNAISTNIALYAEETHYFNDRFALVLGAQAAYSIREFDDDLLTNGDQSDYFDYFSFNPKVGFLYELMPEGEESVQLYGNYSHAFEPPTFGELTNLGGSGLLDLDEQEADSFELGLRGTWGPLRFDVCYYYAMLDGELLGFNVGPSFTPLTVNAEDTVHQGIELGFELDVWQGLVAGRQVQGAAQQDASRDRIVWRNMYFWNDFRFDDDDTFGDNRIAGAPEHFWRSELLYMHPSGFYFGPNLEWNMASYPVDFANTLFADPYVLLGFKVGVQTETGFSAFFEVRNILDEEYAASTGVITDATLPGANVAQFFPGDGRSYFVGVEYRY